MRILVTTIGIWLASFCSALFMGCETPVYDADVQFVERLVINGSITPGQTISGIYVGKTLPVTSTPNPSNAEIHDAVATIAVDGQAYPLYHEGGGLYGTSAVTAVPGKTYNLAVAWNGLRATAETVAPFMPDTTLTTFTRTGIQSVVVNALLTPHPDEVYGMKYDHGYRPTMFSDIEHDYSGPEGLVRATDLAADGMVHLSSSTVYLSPNESSDTLWVTISALDGQFYKYYYSSGTTSDIENVILGVPPASRDWNISGDGIGLFIGIASVTKAIPMHLVWPYVPSSKSTGYPR